MEKQLGKKAELFAPSPLLNLVCIAFEDGDVVLQRVATWQRVWALSQTGFGNARTSAITWKPDGKAIACGFDDGFVRIVDVENSEVQRNVNTDGCVQYLNWTKLNGSEPNSVLIVALRDGSVQLFVDGALHVASFSVRTNGAVFDQDAAFRFEQIDFNERFSVLTATFSVVQSGEGEEAAETSSQELQLDMQVVCFDTRLFAASSGAFEQVAMRLAALQQAIDVLSGALNALAENWHDVVLECERKLSNYATRFHENDRKMALGNDLLEFAMFGTCSVDLDHFLENELAEKVLDKLCEQTRTAFSEVQRIVVETMLPKLQNMLFRIHELDCFVDAHMLLVVPNMCVCALHTDQPSHSAVAVDSCALGDVHSEAHTKTDVDAGGRFGIEPTLVRETLKIIAALLGRTNELLAVTESASSSLHSFLVWLRDAVRERNAVTPSTGKQSGSGNKSLDELKPVVAFIKDNLCVDASLADVNGPNVARNGGQLRAVHNLIRVASPRIGTHFAHLLQQLVSQNSVTDAWRAHAPLRRGAEFDETLAEAQCAEEPLATLVELLGDTLERLFVAFRLHISHRFFAPHGVAHVQFPVLRGARRNAVQLAGTLNVEKQNCVVALLVAGYRMPSSVDVDSDYDGSGWSLLYLQLNYSNGFRVEVSKRVAVSFELLPNAPPRRGNEPAQATSSSQSTARQTSTVDHRLLGADRSSDGPLSTGQSCIDLRAKVLLNVKDERSRRCECVFANVCLDLLAIFGNEEPVANLTLSTTEIVGSFVEDGRYTPARDDLAASKWKFALFAGSNERVCLVSRDRLSIRVCSLKT